MVLEFIHNNDSKIAKRATRYLENYEARVNKRNAKGNKVVANLNKVMEFNLGVKVKNWLEIEKEILRLAVIKYGYGNWMEIKRHLPTKSKQQMYTLLQRMTGKQSLAEYHTLHVDPLILRTVNFERYGKIYYIEEEKVVSS